MFSCLPLSMNSGPPLPPPPPAALKELRCSEDVEQEMEDLRQEEVVDKAEKDMDVMKILYYPGLRWHMISIMVLMAGQQLSGINAVGKPSGELSTSLSGACSSPLAS